MRVVYGKVYDNRTVIGVCLNPDDPPIIHGVGEQRLDADGQKMVDFEGAPILIESEECEPGCSLETCYNARQNHVVREFIFDGEERFTVAPDGKRILRDIDDYLAEIRPKLAPPKPPVNKQSWIGKEV